MSKTVQDSKIQIKYSTITGSTLIPPTPGSFPTIPGSDDHTDGSWLATDIYKGEYFFNSLDKRLWIRGEAGIVEIPIVNGINPLGSANKLLGVNATANALEYKSFSIGENGTDINVVHTLGVITLNIPIASAVNTGKLSATDWSTFNSKQNALGFTPENTANKGQANGYAPLNASTKINQTYLPSLPKSNTIYIDKLGNDTIGDGSIEAPFLTIQKGIDIAVTQGATITNPFIIKIGIGTFTENITMANGINLQGETSNIIDSSVNLTAVSGDISTPNETPFTCSFVGISMPLSTSTITIESGGLVSFRDCAIECLDFIINNLGVVAMDDVQCGNTNPISVTNFSRLILKDCIVDGIDTDASPSELLHLGSIFDRSTSNLLGTEESADVEPVGIFDIEITDNTKGIILTGAPNNGRYRITIDDTTPASPILTLTQL